MTDRSAWAATCPSIAWASARCAFPATTASPHGTRKPAALSCAAQSSSASTTSTPADFYRSADNDAVVRISESLTALDRGEPGADAATARGADETLCQRRVATQSAHFKTRPAGLTGDKCLPTGLAPEMGCGHCLPCGATLEQ
jgi:hypothetical protein